MKFIHIADMHFDTPFSGLKDGNKRRLEQREVFKQIIEQIKENNIPYLFISGDLYEHEYIKQTTIDYINKLFLEIPNTKIFISPGNHDPYVKNSYYEITKWKPNVHIFKEDIEKIELEDVNIYGKGFSDFYSKEPQLQDIKLDKSKLNILIIHGTIDGADEYAPISKKELEEIGFDYVALGHIHKRTSLPARIVYPGSTISLGFDELGEHGIIIGEITKEKCLTQFVKLDPRVFTEIEIDISSIQSKEELIELLNSMSLKENTQNKAILTGIRNFEINISEIEKLLQNSRILKIKDNTKIKYDLNKMKNENSLRGIFIKKCLEKLEKGEYSKDEIERAIEIGLETM